MRIRCYCHACLTWPELFFWHDKTLLSVSQNWFKKKKKSIHSHLFLHKGCQSLFKNDAGSSDTSTPTRSCFKISYRICEKRWKSGPFIMYLSGSVFAGDRKCVLWHLATSSWIISAFWEDTGFITTYVPTPSDATPSRTCESPPGELWQAACSGQNN